MRGIEAPERVGGEDADTLAVLARALGPDADALPTAPDLDRDEHAARRQLRRQIAKLERDLSRAVVQDLQAGARGRVDAEAAPVGAARLLSLGDLEARRDALLARLGEVEERRTEELHNRVLLREMYRDPASHKGRRLETADLAERGCRVYEVVPRFGLVGILGGWWRVKVSSGCPLSPGARRPSHLRGR